MLGIRPFSRLARNVSVGKSVEFSLEGKRVWVAGHRGMAGSAIVRRLAGEGCEVLTADRATLDLRRQDAVEAWVAEVAALTQPDAIHWCDGSDEENEALIAKMLADGTLLKLNERTHPGSYLHRSHPDDVALSCGGLIAGLRKGKLFDNVALIVALLSHALFTDERLTRSSKP